MNTLKQVRSLILAMALSAASIGHAQVTTLGNNSSSGDYVGCDGSSPFPLRIMQNDNQPIQWWTDSTGSTREYLSAKLLAGLEVGRSYRVSLYCARPKGHRRAIDHIGVYFGPDSIHEQHTTVLPFSPQIQLRDPNSAYLLDTNWVELADTLMAQGNERWLVIGTFLDDPQVNGIDLPPLFPQPKAYYYIDAVSVVPLDAEAVEEQLAGYAELSATSEMIRWISSDPLRSLLVIDAAGRLVWQPRVSESREGGVLVPSSLAQGLYTFIAYMGGQRRVVRFIK